jgi:hypothetical protein
LNIYLYSLSTSIAPRYPSCPSVLRYNPLFHRLLSHNNKAISYQHKPQSTTRFRGKENSLFIIRMYLRVLMFYLRLCYQNIHFCFRPTENSCEKCDAQSFDSAVWSGYVFTLPHACFCKLVGSTGWDYCWQKMANIPISFNFLSLGHTLLGTLNNVSG